MAKVIDEGKLLAEIIILQKQIGKLEAVVITLAALCEVSGVKNAAKIIETYFSDEFRTEKKETLERDGKALMARLMRDFEPKIGR